MIANKKIVSYFAIKNDNSTSQSISIKTPTNRGLILPDKEHQLSLRGELTRLLYKSFFIQQNKVMCFMGGKKSRLKQLSTTITICQIKEQN